MITPFKQRITGVMFILPLKQQATLFEIPTLTCKVHYQSLH